MEGAKPVAKAFAELSNPKPSQHGYLTNGEPHMPSPAQVPIASFSDNMLAEVAQITLEAHGIGSTIQKDDCGGMTPHLNVITGIRLMVNPVDEEEASAILNQMPELQ